MGTKTIGRLFVFALAFAIISVASAATKANPRRGKAYFKKHCRVCHDGKTEGTPVLQPAEKIIEQWERAFSRKEDVAECLPRVKAKLGVELTAQDLTDIKAYLISGAADSDRPMTCG